MKLARHATGRPYIVGFLGGFHGRTYGAVTPDRLEGQVPRPLRPAPARHLPRAVRQGRGPRLVRRRPVQPPGPGRTRSPRSSSSRSRARAATSSPRTGSSRASASCARSTASCSSPTRSSRAPGGPGRCGRSSTGASSRTSCSSPRASRRACRSGRWSPRPRSWSPGASGRTARRTAAIRSPAPRRSRRSSCSRAGSSTTPAARGDQALRGPAGARRPATRRLVTDVRGKGLMIGVEFDIAELAEEVQWACFERGLLVLECGKQTVRLCPPLVVIGRRDRDRPADLRRGRCRGRARTRRPWPRGAAAGALTAARQTARLAARAVAPALRRADEQRSKVATMRDAIAELVRDGDTVAIEGFTHLISFAAGHEIIRQRKRDLTLARMTPDLIYDQMIAAGVRPEAHLLVAREPRRRRPRGDPPPDRAGDDAPARTHGQLPRLEVEEYSHFGMVGRYTAGAANLPFYPLRSYFETDLPIANPLIREIESPYGDGSRYAVPPLKPDVTIVHAQRADAAGNTQVWGLLGCQKEAAFAADRVIVVVEELVDESVIRADPEPDDHPGPDRRRGRRRAVRAPIRRTSRAPTTATTVLPRLGRDHPGRGRAPGLAPRLGLRPRRPAAYVEKLGAERLAALKPGSAPSGSVDYGEYRLMATVRYLVAGRDPEHRVLRRPARVRGRRRRCCRPSPGCGAATSTCGSPAHARPPRARCPTVASPRRRLEPPRRRGRRHRHARQAAPRASGATFRNDIVRRPGWPADPARRPRRQPDRAVRGPPVTRAPRSPRTR